MPRPRGGRGRGGLLLAVAVCAALVIAGIRLLPRSGPPSPTRSALPTATPAAPAPIARTARPAGPLLALVIDDAGADPLLADRLLALPAPFTLAVLPFLPHSADYAAIGAAGKELILHLPMEPTGYPEVNPGEGALLSAMGREEIGTRLAEALASVPGAVGVNNHMGSRFTSGAAGMHDLLAALAERGLWFLDSRTTPATVSGEAARDVGLPMISRDVFLDADADASMIPRRWAEALSLASTRGHALVIGHLRPGTVAFIEEQLRSGDLHGVTLVTVSTLLGRADAVRPRG